MTPYDGNFLPSLEAAVIRAEERAERLESLEDAYQLVQQLRFGSSGDGFAVLMRVESYLLNELLKQMSVTREFAADLPPATADDGYEEEEWDDSKTERERFNSITGRG